jgi:CheY-like chemotaxis protein
MADLNITPAEYRPRLREVLSRGATRGSPTRVSEGGLLVVDRIIRSRGEGAPAPEAVSREPTAQAPDEHVTGDDIERTSRRYFYGPQGVGEAKHAPADRKPQPEINEDNIDVDQKDEPRPPGEQVYRYLVHSHLDVSQSRRRMEDRVRRSKRVHAPCPFCTDEKLCSKPFIRCGDRLQYSIRESAVQRSRIHHCTYNPGKRGSYVLIVDDDPRMRDFCRSSFSLFLRYDADRVLTAGSAPEAIEILRRSKIAGDRIGLVISDIVMPGHSGYDLVNELYYRNFDVEVVVMSAEGEHPIEPPDYRGNTEVLPNLPFVGGHLTKPFHSHHLIETIRRLEFGEHL